MAQDGTDYFSPWHFKKLFEVLHDHPFPLCIQPYKAKKYDSSAKCEMN